MNGHFSISAIDRVFLLEAASCKKHLVNSKNSAPLFEWWRILLLAIEIVVKRKETEKETDFYGK